MWAIGQSISKNGAISAWLLLGSENPYIFMPTATLVGSPVPPFRWRHDKGGSGKLMLCVSGVAKVRPAMTTMMFAVMMML